MPGGARVGMAWGWSEATGGAGCSQRQAVPDLILILKVGGKRAPSFSAVLLFCPALYYTKFENQQMAQPTHQKLPLHILSSYCVPNRPSTLPAKKPAPIGSSSIQLRRNGQQQLCSMQKASINSSSHSLTASGIPPGCKVKLLLQIALVLLALLSFTQGVTAGAAEVSLMHHTCAMQLTCHAAAPLLRQQAADPAGGSAHPICVVSMVELCSRASSTCFRRQQQGGT